MGINVSYDWVLEIENSLATAVCKRFEEEDLVAMSCKFTLVTVGALDNIDYIYNPSSTTLLKALSGHGTGISIFQLPSQDHSGIVRDP